MPAIYLFQRRTLYGGDDLHLLALSTSACRLAQLLCYSILAYHMLNHMTPQTAEAEVVRAAAFSTAVGDEMYVRRRLGQVVTDHSSLQLNLGLSLLEYAWMDRAAAANVNTRHTSDFGGEYDDNSGNSCRLSHWLLMGYTAIGMVFGVASLVVLAQIYRTSSMGCPTHQRHPRTETMQPLLEWLFLPLNGVHFLIWLLGVSALVFGYTYAYLPCDEDTVLPSTWFLVIYILAGILLLLSQAVEVVWNFAYVLTLYHHDPHALHWTPHNNHNSPHGSLSSNNNYYDDVVQHEHHELVEQMWADRCQNGCRYLGVGTCYMFGGRELYGNGTMHYGDFARAMADYLETRGVLDVVPSDLMVGFLVLQQVQNQRRLRVRHQVLSEAFSYHSSSVAGFSSHSLTAPNSTSHHSSSTQLNNHRANAKSPNGMRLGMPRTASQEALQQHLLRGQQQQQQQDASSSTSLVDSSSEVLLEPLSPPKPPSKRTVLLQSMGAGSLHNLDNNGSLHENNNHNHTPAKQPPSRNKVTVDHSLPPRSPNPHKSMTSQSPLAAPLPEPKSFQRLLSEHNHADVAILEESARYSKYSLAIYSWYLYLYVNPITGLPKLCMKMSGSKNNRCCLAHHHHPEETSTSAGLPNSASSGNLHHHQQASSNKNGRWEGDNLCEAHKHALLLAAGLENEADLVYVQFKSSFNENPYCILLDHETQAVVVAVRGTFSLEDCVTDCLLEPESMEPLGDEFGFADLARGQYCHGGVLTCARNVYRDLKRHGSLEYLLGTKYPHYQLRLVGHSLGAATSTLLGFMLRQTYPTLRCFNYSPPGCTLTWDMAIQCQSWCTSFVLDCELVPRMSFEALEYLRDEVLDLIARIKVSKIEVARRVVTKTLWCRDKTNATAARVNQGYDVEASGSSAIAEEIGELLDDLLLPAGEVPPDVAATSYRQQLEQFQSIQSERRLARGARRAIRLFPPGKILHLVKTNEEQNCMVNVAKCLTCCMSNAGSLYTPVWIGNGDLNEIVISPTMGTDHFPDRMVEELQGIVRNFGVAPQYR